MKRLLQYITLGLLVPWLLACNAITDNDICPSTVGTGEHKVKVTFTLSMEGAQTRSTRADDGHTWGDNLDNVTGNDYPEIIGNDFENRIKAESLRVLIFTSEGAYKGDVGNLTYFTIGGNTASSEYQFLGEISDVELTTETEYRFMIAANGTLPADITTIGDVLFTGFTDTDISYPNGFIPMWGVLTKTVTLDTYQDLGTIHLLRAAAKVEVCLAQQLIDEGFTLLDVFVNNYAPSGYWFPNNWNRVGCTLDLFHLGDGNTPGAYRPYSGTSNIAKYFVDDAGQSTYDTSKKLTNGFIYLPEFDNTTNTAANISLKLKDGSGKIYEFPNSIEFKDYVDGKATGIPYNLVRNHYYQYTITQVNNGEALDLRLVVNPWDVEEEEFEFTNEVSISKKMQWSGTYVKPNTQNGSILYINGAVDAGTAAQVSFKIDTPVGAQWYASFEGDKDCFAFINADGDEVPNMSGNVGEEATLKIVTVNDHVDEMKSVSLKIVVRTMDGRTIMVNHELMPEALDAYEYYQLRQNLEI